MTTLVALASKDALVMGTDSLATVTRRLVDPLDLFDYFDDGDDFKIKVDDQGKPLLDSLTTIMEEAQAVPYNQLGNAPHFGCPPKRVKSSSPLLSNRPTMLS